MDAGLWLRAWFLALRGLHALSQLIRVMAKLRWLDPGWWTA
jgi:hypothetical protein